MLIETVKLAFQAILRNALRSFLTMLGIVIGVGAVIAMVTIGNGTAAKVSADLEKLGTNLLFVRPGQFGPGRAAAEAGQALRAFLESCTHDHIFNDGRINARAFNSVFDNVTCHIHAVSVVQRAPVGFGKTGPGGGNDDCIRHNTTPLKIAEFLAFAHQPFK